MHPISSYRGNRHTNTPTHRQTGPITIDCAAASAQCNYTEALNNSSVVGVVCAVTCKTYHTYLYMHFNTELSTIQQLIAVQKLLAYFIKSNLCKIRIYMT